MAIEGYIKHKNMICLSYLVSNRNLFEKYNAGFIARCHDDVFLALHNYLNTGSLGRYDQEGCSRLIDEIILAGGKSSEVPSKYLEFLNSNEYS